ncbi:MAG: peptidyl-prolyl cis-trans isomerase [Myxococcota bacterium]
MLRAPLFHFLVLGGLLFALQTAVGREPEVRVVDVSRSELAERIEAFALQVGRSAAPDEVEALERQTVEDAVWLDQAFAVGLPEIDAVVHQRLVQNMRFLDPETQESDAALYARAVELGMERSDTVVRRRLIDRIQAVVRARVRAAPVDEAALRRYYEENAERWREPVLLDFSHVYFSRDKRGARADGDARGVLSRIEREGLSSEAAIALGDPFLGGHALRGATPTRIASRLGPDFAEAMVDARPERWLGPVESAFGPHLVWVDRRIESRIPDYVEIRQRILDDWLEERTRASLREEVARLRAGVEIRWVEDLDAGRKPSAG